MNILWEGARGPLVEKLQVKLNDLGFATGKVNGIYGPSTTKAVIDFQQSQRFFADGIVGPQTFGALEYPVPALLPVGRVERKTVFISYSHTDSKWLENLQVHLKPLIRTGLVNLWDDTRILPGQNWREEIAKAASSAVIAILLVSAHFMASDFIADNELPMLLESAGLGGAQIVPVIISPCVLGGLEKYQAINSPSKTMVEMGSAERDRVWVRVVELITESLNRLY